MKRCLPSCVKKSDATSRGCLLYTLLKSRSAPRSYIVQEQYVDEDALEAHMTAPYSDTLFPAIRKLLERIEVEYFDVIEP